MGLFNRKKVIEINLDDVQKVADKLKNEILDHHFRTTCPPFFKGDGGGEGAKCASCGHYFAPETGETRKVKKIWRNANPEKTVDVYFCSMHIPAWDTAEALQNEGSTTQGTLQNFRKSFAVDENGKLLVKKK